MNQIKRTRFIRVISLIVFMWTMSDALAQCSSVLQSISGAGSNAKIGFKCGTGCDTRFFQVSNGSTSKKWTMNSKTRNPTACGTFYDTSFSEEETVTGSNFSYVVSSNGSTCAPTVTTNTASTEYVRRSGNHVSYTSVCNGGTIGRGSCEEVTVDFVLNTSDTNTCEISSFDTTDYTLVSSETVNDACEGTKTKDLYKLETAESLSTITFEETSTPGYKSEYTTSMTISRAKECATLALAESEFPELIIPTGTAVGAMSLVSDKSSADYIVSRWRMAIIGSDPDEQYKITLNWVVTSNGKSNHYNEERTTGGSDQPVWYYPSEKGEYIQPEEGVDCSYSYSKTLVSATIEEVKKGS